MNSSNFATHFNTLEKWCEGTLAICAYHLPSMQKIAYKSDHLFDLCSTYKIPIAVCLLQKVAKGEINLNKLIQIHEHDLREGSASVLNQLNYASPVHFSVVNLLQFMMQDSCNSATDIILEIIGGPTEVMKTLKQAGIESLSVDHSILELLAMGDEITPTPPKACTLAQYHSLKNQVTSEARLQALAEMKADEGDRGSAEAMCQLLLQIQSYSVLAEINADLLLSIMRRCRTGAKRLMGLLPPVCKVLHKTGTYLSQGQVHDVGVIYLPNDEAIAIAVYIENAATLTKGERAIAEAARSIYDYFLFKE